jgi:cytoskeletal protein CcmA (bactofilin family)
MALWKEQTPAKPAGNAPVPTSAEPVRLQPEAAAAPAPAAINPTTPAPAPARAANVRQLSESLIASDLTIEGKIHGTGHVRIAGQFKGDVNVEGDLTIERGAKLTGGVRASKITIAGELEGNVESAQRVELLEGGILTGDLKAGAFTVAAGARMRGQVEFGWDEKSPTARPGNESNA